MSFYWLLLVILAYDGAFSEEERRQMNQPNGSNTCTTLNSTVGTCINIRSCQPLLNLLLTRGREPTVAAYLKQSQCGTEDKGPKVCCPATAVTEHTDYSQCGKSNKRDTHVILEYNRASTGDWPWVVALGYGKDENPGSLFRCGGSLISNQWVLTAAHCVSNSRSLVPTTVRVGDFNLNDTVEDKATPIDQIIPHPEFSSHPAVVNDIALIRLKNPVTFTKLIRPVCILSEAEQKSDEFYRNKRPFVTGWGPTDFKHEPTTISLQDFQVEIVDGAECSQDYSNHRSSLIDERVICAKDDKYSFLGDQSKSMIIPIGGKSFHLAGVESFGSESVNDGYTRVYTKVAHFADWIKRTAQL